MSTKALIKVLVDKTVAMCTAAEWPREEQLEVNTQAFVQLTRYGITDVIAGLIDLYNKLVRTGYAPTSQSSQSSPAATAGSGGTLPRNFSQQVITPSSGSTPAGGASGSSGSATDAPQRVLRNKLFMLRLLSQTLSSVIPNKKVRLHFDDDLLNENVLVSDAEPASEVSALPSQSIDKDIASKLIDILIETIYFGPDSATGSSGGTTRDSSQTVNQILVTKAEVDAAARVFFKLTIISSDVVFERISNFISSIKNDESDFTMFKLLEFAHLDVVGLAEMINQFNDLLFYNKIKKPTFYSVAMRPLCRAIWNWINNYPNEFVQIAKSKTPLHKCLEQLFDGLDSWAGGSSGGLFGSDSASKKALVWPLQTLLLLLSPATFSSVVMTIKQGKKDKKDSSNKLKFMEDLLEALRKGGKKGLADPALLCCVFLCKASMVVSKADYSALHFLIPDIQNTLQERLFANVAAGTTDQGYSFLFLTVDFLTSCFRLNPRNFTSYFVPLCFGSGNQSQTSKGSKDQQLLQAANLRLAITRAILRVAQERDPNLASSVSFLAPELRSLFQTLHQIEKETEEKVASSGAATSGGKSGPNVVDGPSTNAETLVVVMEVFHAAPELAFYNTSPIPAVHINEMMFFFLGLTNCLALSRSPSVLGAATRLVRHLFDIEQMRLWCKDDPANSFVEIGSSIAINLCYLVSQEKNVSSELTRVLVDLLRAFILNSNKVLAEKKAVFTTDILNKRRRIQALESLETSLLVTLCSYEHHIWLMAAETVGYICEQIEILGMTIETKQNCFLSNFDIYQQLGAVPSTFKGEEVQRKQIRTLLGRMRTQTKGNLAAFIEVYSRWKLLTGEVDKTSAVDEDVKRAYENYTVFLCTLGGVSLSQGAGLLDEYKSEQSQLTDELIRDILKLATSPDVGVYIREMVVSTIGTDFSPSLYGPLFTNINDSLGTFFGELGQLRPVTSQSTLFVEQAITAMHNIINQAVRGSGAEVIKQINDLLATNTMEQVVVTVVRYCSQLVVNEETLRMRGKFCVLLSAMMEHIAPNTNTSTTPAQGMVSNVRFRTETVRKLMEWTSEYASAARSAVSQTSFKELDAKCLGAIAALLKGLQLAPATQQQSEGSSDFMDYLNFLLRYLRRCKEKDAHPMLRECTVRSMVHLLQSNIGHGLEHFMKLAYNDDEAIRSAFLSVLTDLVKHGVAFSSQNEENRDSQQSGNRPQTIAEKYAPFVEILFANNFSVVSALMSSVAVKEQDELCVSLIRLFESHRSRSQDPKEKNKTVELLCRAIDKEVSNTVDSGTLFRANSVASKLMKEYSNLIGSNYLRSTLSQLVQDLCDNPLVFGPLEVDPSKLLTPANFAAGEDPSESMAPLIKSNTENLRMASTKFLDAILSSVYDCPRSIRVVCHHLMNAVDRKFPGAPVGPDVPSVGGLETKHIMIGGFIFLRFICPAIVTPQEYGITEGLPSDVSRRHLILISKVLQNVSNGVTYSRKEPFMKPMEDYISNRLEDMKLLAEKLAAIDEDDESELTDPPSEDATSVSGSSSLEPVIIPQIQYEQSLMSLHRLLHSVQKNSADKLKDLLTGETGVNERLVEVLALLGEPPEPPKAKRNSVKLPPTPASAGPAHNMRDFTNSMFEEFCSKLSEIDISQIEERNMFYHHPNKTADQKSNPVFYLIARRYEEEENESDQIIYHIIKTMQEHFVTPYDVVFDSTHWDKLHEMRATTFMKLIKLLPHGARKNLRHIFIINPNKYFKEVVKKLGKIVDKKRTKKIIFINELRELYEHIDEKNLALPSDTIALEKEMQTTFSPVTRVVPHRNPDDVVVKLSKKNLRLVTLNQSLLGRDNVSICDFILIRWINSATIFKTTTKLAENTKDDDLVIKYGWPEETLILRTPLKDNLLQAVLTMCSQLKSDHDTIKGAANAAAARSINPNDIPGSILCMSLLNIESESIQTRIAAYNLLVAFATSQHMLSPSQSLSSVTNSISLVEGVAGVYIPQNTEDWVLKLSEQFAQSHWSLTLEFLTEALHGFKLATNGNQKLMCLNCMKPWMKNMGRTYKEAAKNAGGDDSGGSGEASEKMNNIRKWFDTLIKQSIHDDNLEVRPMMLTSIWSEFDENIAAIALDGVLQKAFNIPANSPEVETLADITISLAANNANIVVKDIIDRVFKVIQSEIQAMHDINLVDATSSVSASSTSEGSLSKSDSNPWFKVILLTRLLLGLSFQNRINVAHSMPHVAYLVTLLAGRGPAYIRVMVHSMCTNLLHSIIMSTNIGSDQRAVLKNYMVQLYQPRLRQIFRGAMDSANLNDAKSTSITSTAAGPGGDNLEEVNMYGIESLVQFLNDVMQATWNAEPSLKFAWSEPWTSVCQSALRGNPVFLPRALCAFGVATDTKNAEEMFPYVILLLSRALGAYTPVQKYQDLCISAFLCLARLWRLFSSRQAVRGRVSSSIFTLVFTKLLSIPILFLPGAGLNIFEALVYVLRSSLEAIFDSPETAETYHVTSIAQFFSKSVFPDEKLAPFFRNLESSVGVAITEQFGFGLATFLLKGIKAESTRQCSLDLINTLFRIDTQLSGAAYSPGAAPQPVPTAASSPATSSTSTSIRRPPATGGSNRPPKHETLQVRRSAISINEPEPSNAPDETKKEVQSQMCTTPDSFAYIAALLPFESEPFHDMAFHIGGSRVLEAEALQKGHNAVLFVNYLLSFADLTHTSKPFMAASSLSIVSMLNRAVHELPLIFVPPLRRCLHRVVALYRDAPNPALEEALRTLIDNVVVDREGFPASSSADEEDALKQIKCDGMANLTAFKNEKNDSLKLTIGCVKMIIEECNSVERK